MDAAEFSKSFIEEVKSAAAVSGEGKSAEFTDQFSQYLMEADVIPEFTNSFCTGNSGRSKYRVDGYVYDPLDQCMTLVVTDFDVTELDRRMTNALAQKNFHLLSVFLQAALKTNLYREIEISTPGADLIDFLRANQANIRKYKFLIFTNAVLSSSVKTVEVESYDGIPVEGQIWDLERLYRNCCSDQGREIIEIDFLKYSPDGIPCLEASSAATAQYKSYLGVIPGEVLADLYDAHGSRLLEGNVRSFLSTKTAVNKKIRNTIKNNPKMFFAFNNGISATGMDVKVQSTENGKFITSIRDFQIINGGQTTASLSNARYKDKADLSDIFVQMKLTAIDEVLQAASDELVQDISRSSNSQNKVSDADFFANHPFHVRMENISTTTYAPASGGSQFETLWFYERARGQYLQAQMRMTEAKKRQFKSLHPKNQVIRKTDLAKVQNTWRGLPHIVSKGAQTNFASFAEYIDREWTADDEQFNVRYFQSTAALLLIFKYLESVIPKQEWYNGGYRANIIYYTVALFHRLIKSQFPGKDLDLMQIWQKQEVPRELQLVLLGLSEEVFYKLTDPNREVDNVTQWCKKEACWKSVLTIQIELPDEIRKYLISSNDEKHEQKQAKKEQKLVNGIDDQTKVVSYSGDQWAKVARFAVEKHLITQADANLLKIATQIPLKIPTDRQSKKLLNILKRCTDDGFDISKA